MSRTNVWPALCAAALLILTAGVAHAQTAPTISGSVISMLDGTSGSITVDAPVPVGVALVRRGKVVQAVPAKSTSATLTLAKYAILVPGDTVNVTDTGGATLTDFKVPAHPVGGCGTTAATGTLPGDGTVTIKQETDKGGGEVKAGAPFSVELASGDALGKTAKLSADFTVTGSENGYATSFAVSDVQRVCPVSTDFQVSHTSFDSAHGRFTLTCKSGFAGGEAQVLATSPIAGKRRTVARVKRRTKVGSVTFHVKLSARAKRQLFHAHSLPVRVELTAHRAGDTVGVHHTYNFTLHHS